MSKAYAKQLSHQQLDLVKNKIRKKKVIESLKQLITLITNEAAVTDGVQVSTEEEEFNTDEDLKLFKVKVMVNLMDFERF